MEKFENTYSENKITFAVFGDIHGALDKMFAVCESYENIYSEKIDYILQSGDLGVFHYGSKLDKTTKRFASKDPTELGCMPYISGEKISQIPVIFVSGNHEDFDFLSCYQNNYIDPYNKIFYLKSGEIFIVEKGELQIKIAGLGGIQPKDNLGKLQQKCGKYLDPKAISKLLSYEPGSIDIFLCHESPKTKQLCETMMSNECGSEEIREIIENLQPKFCFYGHYNKTPEPYNIGNTIVIGMSTQGYFCLPNRKCNIAVVSVSRDKGLLNWNYKLLKKDEIYWWSMLKHRIKFCNYYLLLR